MNNFLHTNLITLMKWANLLKDTNLPKPHTETDNLSRPITEIEKINDYLPKP